MALGNMAPHAAEGLLKMSRPLRTTAAVEGSKQSDLPGWKLASAGSDRPTPACFVTLLSHKVCFIPNGSNVLCNPGLLKN